MSLEKQIRFTLSALLALAFSTAYAAPESTPVSSWQLAEGSMWALQDPTDTQSARALAAVTGPDYDVYDHDAAVLDLLKDTQLQLKQKMSLRKIDAWRRLNGSDLRAGLANTEINGKPAVLFMTVKQRRGSETFELYAVLMPRTTFEPWGGIVWMMVDAGLIPKREIFSSERIRQISAAPFNKQLDLFAQAAEVKVELLAKQLNDLAMQQMLTTQMLSLNLDLMFGELAQSPVLD
ncbi:MAG: hypothetical protein AAGL69_03145 [Pseudomonadota bacterium]